MGLGMVLVAASNFTGLLIDQINGPLEAQSCPFTLASHT